MSLKNKFSFNRNAFAATLRVTRLGGRYHDEISNKNISNEDLPNEDIPKF
jgi:hypothetical protein